MNAMRNRFPAFWLCLLALTSTAGAASPGLDDLLARPVAPHGVVFEIVDRDPRALDVALPWVKQAAQRLKMRFPALPMALVTPWPGNVCAAGRRTQQASAVHQIAEGLSRDGIPVHVCETYAGWRGIGAENFPEYIDVAPAGSDANSQLRSARLCAAGGTQRSHAEGTLKAVMASGGAQTALNRWRTVGIRSDNMPCDRQPSHDSVQRHKKTGRVYPGLSG